MSNSGISLDKYTKNNVFRGVVTGYNPAFVIDGVTRAKLVQNNPHVSGVIKPLAIGDNIRKWQINYQDQWLIYMHHGIDISELESIVAHLRPYKTNLEGRATRQEWYELQQPQMRYLPEFAKPKIVYPEIAKEPRFAFDDQGVFTNNKAFFIPMEDLYLLGILNSSPAWEYAKSICAVLGDENKGGRLMLQWVNLKKLPIPHASISERDRIAAIVRRILDNKDQVNSVLDWEAEIDERVARLYGLSAADLNAIRGEQGKG